MPIHLSLYSQLCWLRAYHAAKAAGLQVCLLPLTQLTQEHVA